MNMPLRKPALVVVALGLLGCSPLQQAPLVYSSKVAVGVDVSSNAAESPGISISLGVKTVDAAYVPVAVSKKADPADPAASAVDIIRISAQYGQGATKGDSNQLTESNRQRINAYIDARKAANDAAIQKDKAEQDLGALKRKRDAIDLANTQVSSLGTTPPADAPVSPTPSEAASAAASVVASEKTKRDDAIQTKLNPLLAAVGDSSIRQVSKGELDLSGTQSALAQLSKTVAGSIENVTKTATDAASDATAKNARAEDLFRQAAQAASLLETSKTDAMSVYGRFDSNGSASVPGGAASGATGGLLVGKVFSTGLASQNLTEAVKVTAVATCIGNAMQAAGAASGPTTDARNNMVSAVAAACGTTIGNR